MPIDRIQRWLALGLAPFHQALLRRIAQRDAADRQLELEWLNTDSSDSPEALPWTAADVLVVQRQWLLSTLELNAGKLPWAEPGRRRKSMALIWNWSIAGSVELAWSVPWVADGVIEDPQTLQSWVRSALRCAPQHPKPPHPLLEGLHAPAL
ncbi:MAG: hypothetical protein ACK5OB_14715 [Pirellula sp.]|jgi:hypothetical protein